MSVPARIGTWTSAIALVLVNRGSTTHNFTVVGTKVSIDVRPGRTVREPALRALGLHTGVYRFYCRFHRSKGMVGELHVLAA